MSKMLKVSKQKSFILLALAVGGVALVYVLSQSTLEAESTSLAAPIKRPVSLDAVSDKSSSHQSDLQSSHQSRLQAEVQTSQMTKSESTTDSIVASKSSTHASDAKKFRPVSKDFKDEIRKREESKSSLQLERTLPDGTIVMDTVEVHTSTTVVLLTEDGEPVQGHGGLILNAPEMDTESLK